MKFVFPLLSFKKHGGVRVLSILMNTLSREAHDVYLLVPEDTYEEFYRIDPKVKKIFIPKRGRNPLRVLRTLLYLFLKAPPTDFTVVSFFPTFFPAFLHRIFKKSKLIYYIQDAEQLFYPFPFSILATLTYLLPSNIKICASDWIKKKTVIKGKVVNPPIDKAFYTTPLQSEKILNHIVLFFRWDKRKGPGPTQRILQNPKFSQFEFFIVGQNPGVKKENVHYLGTLKTEELIKVYDHCSFFLLTSKFEGFGLPPLEAMARGCIPISFTNTGPSDYIIEGKNGFFVKSEDELYNTLEEILKNSEKFWELSKNCILTAKRFSEEKFVTEFEACLKSS